MSPQAVVNPEELERFATNLKQFNGQLLDNMQKLRGEFGRLGDTWRDQEHQKFAQEFDQTMRVLRQFMQTADDQIPFLYAKARKAREYLTYR